jgi:hypothetical protein
LKIVPKTVSDLRDIMEILLTKSGLRIVEPHERLLRFCREEFDYYDGISDLAPNRILPLDVLVTISVNSSVNSAQSVRTVHRALVDSCERLLQTVPPDASLLEFDSSLDYFKSLVHAAVQPAGVLLPVATKVLHRKRRSFVPMLDNIIIGHYLKSLGQIKLTARTQSKQHAAAVAVKVCEAFRDDLQSAIEMLIPIQSQLAREGFPLTAVRILEILVWMETEPRGYYRTQTRRAVLA